MTDIKKHVDIPINTDVSITEFEAGYYEVEDTNEPYYYNGRMSVNIHKLFERDVTLIRSVMDWKKPVKMTLTLRFE